GGTSLAFQAKRGVGTLRRSLTCGYEDSALRAFKKSFRVTYSQSQEINIPSGNATSLNDLKIHLSSYFNQKYLPNKYQNNA
ncbi:MAG: hypothetical protein LBQ84_06560, partial [Flavobacteriaceae bacterium]|nr:hypothetical protein [Flavobacteriaceae bacterium]